MAETEQVQVASLMTERGHYVGTFTGKKFFPLAPRADEVCIEDIAHALSNICRYNGHTKRFYSVAEHSVLVSRLVVPEFAREALLHDCAEAYIGDMTRPLKRHKEMAGFLVAEAKIEAAVTEHFGIRNDEQARAAWREFDDRILVDEVRELVTNPAIYFENPFLAALKPTHAEILCLPPERAELIFLARFYELFPERRPFDDFLLEIL